MAVSNTKQIGDFQKLIIKNPIAFTAAIFCIAFITMYYLNTQLRSSNEAYYKQLYQESQLQLQKERDSKDKLTTELLINNGIIQKQNEVIVKADSTLKDNVAVKVEKILKDEIRK